jgi:hypothetical protein
MKYRRCLSGLALLAGVCLLAVTASPAVFGRDDKKLTRAEEEAKKKAETNAQVVLQLALAHDLAEQGRKTKSPLALVTAAQLLRTIAIAPLTVKDKPKVEYEKGAEPGKDEEPEPALSLEEEVAMLLKEARSVAKKQADASGTPGDREAAKAIDTLARQVENLPLKKTRSAKGGPQERTGFLHPGQSHSYAIDFNGLTPEYVRAFGNGQTILRISVLNSRGVLRGEEASYNPGGSWYSGPGGGVFTIRISNMGNRGTSYRMITN